MREPGERYALQTLESKYLLFTEGEDEYYDLLADPYEVENLVDRGDPSKDELRRALIRMVGELKSEEEADLVEEETLERLESLGYVD